MKGPAFKALSGWGSGYIHGSTHTMEEIDEHLGIVSVEPPYDSDHGWTG